MSLALIVLLAHAYALTLINEFSFFEKIFDSNFAVRGFFAISGYLVTLSYINSKNNTEYFEKRLRRIYPAYIACIGFCLLLGAISTKLKVSDFFQSPDTIQYLIANSFFLNFLQPTLPLVFDNHPVQAINGALWTIKVELMLYLCLPIIMYLNKKMGIKTSNLLIFILSVIWVYFFSSLYTSGNGVEIARQFPGQLSYFIVGSYLAANREKIKISIWVVIISASALWCTTHPVLRLILEPIAYATIVIFLSTNAFRNMHFGRYGDISYGIYLYHFPIIQFFLYFGIFKFNPWFGLGVSILTTVIIAFCSWHFVEKRILKRNSHYVNATSN